MSRRPFARSGCGTASGALRWAAMTGKNRDSDEGERGEPAGFDRKSGAVHGSGSGAGGGGNPGEDHDQDPMAGAGGPPGQGKR